MVNRKIVLLGALFLLCQAIRSEDLLFKDVTVLDPSTESQTQGHLWVRDGKIVSISPNMPKNLPVKSKIRIFEAKGKWVIPGLVDTHVHSTFGNPGIGGAYERLSPEQTATLALYCGVTAIVDLLADESVIFLARENQRKRGASSLGARILAAGPMITAPGGHGTEFGFPNRTLIDANSAKKEVLSLSKKHPDVIKFSLDRSQNFKNLDFATLQAAIAKAKELKIPVIVHIATWADAEEAVKAGAPIITHLDSNPIPDSLIALMKEKKVMEIPTMTYQVDFVNLLENRSILESSLLKKVIGATLYQSYKNMDPSDSQVANLAGTQSKKREGYLQNLKKLKEAGIVLMAGTDAGDLGVFQGFSLHREMKIFQDVGMSPWQILKSATSTSKKLLKISVGIQPGDVADFVVVNNSPLEDIRNTQEIEWVVFQGKWVDREKLLTRFSF